MNNFFDVDRAINDRPGAPRQNLCAVEAARRRGLKPIDATQVPNPWGLTAVEVSVIDGIADGQTTIEMAKQYDRRDKTIQSHLAHIRNKMEAKHTAHAAAMWALFNAGVGEYGNWRPS
jgi:DNA-binding CsgD family transcriptional regulator